MALLSIVQQTSPDFGATHGIWYGLSVASSPNSVLFGMWRPHVCA